MRHLKSKIRDEDQHKVNSPWNIRESNEENGGLPTFDECTRQAQNHFALVATPFKVDMSFSADGIKSMLEEYEGDHHTGMDVAQMAGLIYAQTSGYPFLVSRLCQLIDEEVCGENGYYAGRLSEGWTRNGLDVGYMLSFNFNKTKETGVKQVHVGEKLLYEATV